MDGKKIIRTSTTGIVIYLLCFGIAMAFFPIRPFWNDEWRLIYNIKFKEINQLWGALDLLQECPRVYLSLLKIISSFFDYSYISLRLPPLIIGFTSVFIVFSFRKKLYPAQSVYSYFFILILVSSQTFTDYLTQVKQYEMDILLSLVVLWQLMTLLRISKDGIANKYLYALLCCSFLVVPYFSYIYPIAIAPVFPVILLSSIAHLKKGDTKKVNYLLSLYLPLLIVTISIVIFYFIDVKNVLANNRMYLSYLKSYYRGGKETFIGDFWNLFALVGSGFLFELVFGIVGTASFFYGIYRLVRKKVRDFTDLDYFRLYALLLLIALLFLFASGKLIGGVARLTAYSVPSIAILIISFLDDIKVQYRQVRFANVVAGILFLGLFGNILSTCINSFTYPEYSNRIKTYRRTSQALKEARENRVPLLYTDGVCGDKAEENAPAPGKIISNMITPEQIAGEEKLCAEVILKVNPEYKVRDSIPVYFIPDMKWRNEYMKQLPAPFKSAIAFDGINIVPLRR